jgi:hypothetical protein
VFIVALFRFSVSVSLFSIKHIDLTLIDQQSVGKRSLHLMGTVNAKRWTTIYWRVNKFLKESYIVTNFDKERVSFMKINAINDISFFGTSVIIVVL